MFKIHTLLRTTPPILLPCLYRQNESHLVLKKNKPYKNKPYKPYNRSPVAG